MSHKFWTLCTWLCLAAGLALAAASWVQLRSRPTQTHRFVWRGPPGQGFQFRQRYPGSEPGCRGDARFQLLATSDSAWTVCRNGLYHQSSTRAGVLVRFLLKKRVAQAFWPLPARLALTHTVGLLPAPDGTLAIVYRANAIDGPLVLAVAGAKGWDLSPTLLSKGRGRLLAMHWRGPQLEVVWAPGSIQDPLALKSDPALWTLRAGKIRRKSFSRSQICKGPCRLLVAYPKASRSKDPAKDWFFLMEKQGPPAARRIPARRLQARRLPARRLPARRIPARRRSPRPAPPASRPTKAGPQASTPGSRVSRPLSSRPRPLSSRPLSSRPALSSGPQPRSRPRAPKPAPRRSKPAPQATSAPKIWEADSAGARARAMPHWQKVSFLLRSRVDLSLVGVLPHRSLALKARMSGPGLLAAFPRPPYWRKGLRRSSGHFLYANGQLTQTRRWLKPGHLALFRVDGESHSLRLRNRVLRRGKKVIGAVLALEKLDAYEKVYQQKIAKSPIAHCLLPEALMWIPASGGGHWLLNPTGCLMKFDRQWRRSDGLSLMDSWQQLLHRFPHQKKWIYQQIAVVLWFLWGFPLCLLVAWGMKPLLARFQDPGRDDDVLHFPGLSWLLMVALYLVVGAVNWKIWAAFLLL